MAELSALIYRSSAPVPFGPDDLAALAARAQDKNARLDITGYLSHRDDRFTQYLEGPSSALRTLYATIAEDPRHTVDTKVDLLVTERRFPTWSMKLLNPLWHPTGSELDVIDELLHPPHVSADHETIRPSLVRLLDRIGNSERY